MPWRFGRSPSLLASKNLEKTEVGATLSLRIAQERSQRPQDAFKSAPIGLKTTPRAFQEASGRPQECSNWPQDGSKSAQEASRRPQERSNWPQDGPKSAPRGLETPQERSRSLQDGPESSPAGFETAQSLFQLMPSSSASLEVCDQESVQRSCSKNVRRSCSFPLSSTEQA